MSPKPTKASLTRHEAIQFLNSLPYLVASSDTKLLKSMIKGVRHETNNSASADGVYDLEFPVTIGKRVYTFELQPFRIIREITEKEYLAVLPGGAKARFYYQIHTD